jgi:hypothetical protein
MTDEYTPTVQEVRDAWWRDQNTPGDLDIDDRHDAAFRRMIAQVERAAAAKALREAAQSVEDVARQGGGLQTAAAAIHREADRIESEARND